MIAFLILYYNSLHMSLLLDEWILKRVSISLGGRKGEGENKPQKVKQGNMFLVGRGELENTVLDFKFFQGRNCFFFFFSPLSL